VVGAAIHRHLFLAVAPMGAGLLAWSAVVWLRNQAAR
jgi:hypothetical protein